MGLQIYAKPSTEPITLNEFKAHIHFDTDDQDDWLNSLIASARQAIETETNRALLTQDWQLTLSSFPGGRGVIYLPNPPVQSITSISYTDENGDSQSLTASDYQTDIISEPARLAPACNQNWPAIDAESLAPVSIIFRCGWTLAANVPNELKHAIKLLAAHWFENTSGVTDMNAKELPFAIKALVTHWIVPYYENFSA